MKLRSRLAVLAASGFLISGFVTAGVATSASAATSGDISGTPSVTADVTRLAKGTGAAAMRQALAAYWTPARMMVAKPDSELPALRTTAAAGAQANATAPSTNLPAQRIGGAAATTTPKATGTPGVAPMAYYPNYPVGSLIATTNGKVFFTNAGINYVCSGSIVNSEGKSLVWTAGHCVSDGGTWNYNWVFVPNYVNGSAPYGYWYSAQLWTKTAWFNNNNDFANDVGASIMFSNSGWHIADYLGGQGIAWNQGTGYFMSAFGYPQAAPFNGAYLTEEDNYTYDMGDGTIYQLNAMTGGSSGGPWLLSWDGSPYDWAYVNGHNDFKYTAYPAYMFSPYYGDQVASLFATVRGLSA